jgi:hypothetical protein
MATTNSVLSLLLTLIAFSLLLFPRCIGAHPLKVCMFDAIYQLGDSISDTGNLIRENPAVAFARLPYGETSFKKATGRCSNGLLMIDYIGKNHIKLVDVYVFYFIFIFQLLVCEKVIKKINKAVLLERIKKQQRDQLLATDNFVWKNFKLHICNKILYNASLYGLGGDWMLFFF